MQESEQPLADSPSAIPPDAFAFGENWRSFLNQIDEQRVAEATRSLRDALGSETLSGRRFLDLGCGSGLSSLAAYRLGADVISVDYDPECVACAKQLRQRFAAGDVQRWAIEQGSVLDEAAMQALGMADVVYSWGVLHHTGDMRRAIELASERVAPGGLFLIAIYNDQGGPSRRWRKIKQFYQRLPRSLRPLWVLAIATAHETRFALSRAIKRENPLPWNAWRQKKLDRGMSVWHDWTDWVGGYPFEVARVEEMVVPLRRRGFVLENLKTVGSGWGCNEYLFRRNLDR